MELYTTLARQLLRRHPTDAARALEQISPLEAAGVLASAESEVTAKVLASISPGSQRPILEGLDDSVLAAAFLHLAIDQAARLIRHVDPKRHDALLAALPQRFERSLRTMLHYPVDSAGSLMDPDVLALPFDLTAREAIERIRSTPKNARYNVYVTDANQRLIGVVNLREILLAPPRESLESFMHSDVHSLPARADRILIVSHPGWQAAHALPVVGDDHEYLGAIRYRTLRRLEHEIRGVPIEQNETARALGDLFATGAVGMLEALTGANRSRERGVDGA